MNAERALDAIGMKASRHVDWKRTKIHASEYASSHDIWQRLEPGDEAPRFAIDDVLDGRYESPARRDRIAGRNQKFGTMRGSLSVAMDSADFGSQPTGVLADLVEKRLRGKTLNLQQRGYLAGLRVYLADKPTIGECSSATIRGLLMGLIA